MMNQKTFPTKKIENKQLDNKEKNLLKHFK